MSSIEVLGRTTVFGGQQIRFTHASSSCRAPMTATVFLPHGTGPFPALIWLSGLTCTDENFMQKAGAQRIAAELGIALVAPDTSPRDLGIEGENDGWDFGSGAGFYVNATQEPWRANYQMFDYVNKELPALVANEFPLNGRFSISGHSMGGHGALVSALRCPERYVSASAFAPIAHPSECPWGHKALGGYLGDDRNAWAHYDTVTLLKAADDVLPMRIDQGGADEFLQEQLGFDDLQRAAARFEGRIETALHDGYDHSYYFIASFIEAHMRFHYRALVSA